MTFQISKSKVYNNHFRISTSIRKHEAKGNVEFLNLCWVYVLNDMVKGEIVKIVLEGGRNICYVMGQREKR